MTPRRSWASMALALVACLVALTPGGGARAAQATAVITGRVVSDDATATPIRRASVTLNPSEGSATGFTAITEDDGRFAFSGVPAGRYHLTARKAGYVRASFGATRPGRPGTPVAVETPGTPREYVLRLVKGAVITGVIRDAMGDPAANVQVEFFRVRVVNGVRFTDVHESQPSDDRGMYRLHSLSAGDYIVSALYRPGHGSPDAMNLTSAGDVQWAERQLRATTTTTTEPPPDRARAGYAPVFFPGTINGSQAQVISVAAAEERSGVDFTLQLVPMTRLDGTVVSPDGTPAGAMVFLVPADTTSVMGFSSLRESHGPRFSFGGLTAGTYTLLARSSGGHDDHTVESPFAAAGGEAARPRQPPAAMWATTTVSVGTVDLKDVTVTLQPALEVSGRVIFEASTGTAPNLDSAEVRFTPAGSQQRLSFGGTAKVEADGRFRAANLMPGTYMVTMSVRRGTAGPAQWTVRSITAGTRQVPDVAFEVSDRSVADVIVTVTDRVTALGGTLSTAGNRPAPDFYVIAFPADRTYWAARSARVQAVRPATDGAFLFSSLPPGDYLVAALTDVENEEWHDPAFLAELRSAAIAVKVVEGTTTTQNIRIAR